MREFQLPHDRLDAGLDAHGRSWDGRHPNVPIVVGDIDLAQTVFLVCRSSEDDCIANAEEGRHLMESFMKDALPGASVRERAFTRTWWPCYVLGGQGDLWPEPVRLRGR